MGFKMNKKARLLKDPDVGRWYTNVSWGSLVTADVSVWRLGLMYACDSISGTWDNWTINSSHNLTEYYYRKNNYIANNSNTNAIGGTLARRRQILLRQPNQ